MSVRLGDGLAVEAFGYKDRCFGLAAMLDGESIKAQDSIGWALNHYGRLGQCWHWLRLQAIRRFA